MSALAAQALKRIVVPVALLLAVMIGLGLLVTKTWTGAWPFTAEDDVSRGLVGERTDFWNGVTWFFSMVGSTGVIVAVTALVAVILLRRLRRWREPLFLCAAVSAQALVFLFTTMSVGRTRPEVPHLDQSPPTTSFPSGHTSAAVALYLGLAFVLAMLVRRTWLKALCWALLLVPVAVALSRLYRGMHHPSDVVGSFLNGLACVVIMARAVLDQSVSWARSRLSGAGPAGSGRAASVARS